MEDQVAVLVELFAKTKRREVSDYDLFGWRKTFRIMLEHHRIPFEDIEMVVTALGDKRLCLDFARYNTPYDLRRDDREWENILASVKLALEREESRPNPPRRQHFDDDEYDEYIPYSRCSYKDGCGAADMAANAEERHRRYLARQHEPPRSPWTTKRSRPDDPMTGSQARRIGLDRALQEVEILLAAWYDEQPVNIDDSQRWHPTEALGLAVGLHQGVT